MPEIIMMVGLPGSGKSTFIRNNYPDHLTLSSDAYIEDMAKAASKTYNEVFDLCINNATRHVEDRLRLLIQNYKSFVWDQTNLTAKTRRKKLAKVPNTWQKTAVVFPNMDPEALFEFINEVRPGKTIPLNVLKMMHNQYEPVSTLEKFDKILNIQEPPVVDFIKSFEHKSQPYKLNNGENT